jgi:hypothetical protein
MLSIELDTEVVATGIPDGRLKLNEVRAIVVIGCEECSATVEIIRDVDRIAIIYPPATTAVHTITK